ncbi:hypothetical protein [Streptomyces sp. NPDC053048]|uniref:hypothetical protein n=1 Tax=Streptomyces sp. NPDC053048 TaxID=3365694 RepID=UPI0037D906FA
MVAVALLMPPLLLCLVLALGRYEERVLKNVHVRPDAQPRHALPPSRLRAVPDLPTREPPADEPSGRHAA